MAEFMRRLLQQKINERMDDLQAAMENDEHLKDPERIYEITTSVSKFWSVLSDEDKDYIQCAQHAIEDKLPWGVPDKSA